METHDDHSLHASIDAKLAEIARTSPAPPAWFEAWSRLKLESTDRERLAVYQAVRGAGSLPPEAAFFLVGWMIDKLADQHAEEALRDSLARLESLRLKYGLDEDAPANSDAPAEYRDAMRQHHEAWDQVYRATLREYGELKMARLFEDDRAEFDRIHEIGRQYFDWSAADDAVEDDDWLDSLLEAVGNCVEADSPMGPLGLRYREAEGFWEVWIYPTPVELVGGRHDGEIVVPGFTLDLEQLRSCFDSLAAIHWNALGLNLTEGPHVSIEGVYEGREVFLQVLAYAPRGETPGLKVDATRRRRRDP